MRVSFAVVFVIFGGLSNPCHSIVIELFGISAKGEKVLLAEGDESDRKMLLKLLLHLGAIVDIATNVNQAKEMASDNRYDAIFVDLHSSEMNGPDLVRYFKLNELKSGRKARIVGLNWPSEGESGRPEVEMDEYVNKPYSNDQIWDAIQSGPSDESVFDSVHLSDLSGGDVEFEKEVLDTFLDTVPGMVSELTNALAEGQKEVALRSAHTLKGSSRSVGANELGNIFQKIEEQVRADETPALTGISEAIARLTKVTSSYFDKKAA